MALPIRTTLDDINEVCRYLGTKPTGATIKDAKAVLDAKRLDARKISAMTMWGLIVKDEEDGKLKLAPAGRTLVKGDAERAKVLREVIRNVPAYAAIIERAGHRHEDSLSTVEVASHWHDHFREDVGNTDKIIKDQAVCFFHVASGASLGTIIPGRGGKPTRISLGAEAVAKFVGTPAPGPAAAASEMDEVPEADVEVLVEEEAERVGPAPLEGEQQLGQAIFVAHGKNKKPLEQLKGILDGFHIPYKVAVEEPNLGRPISGKVREVMRACNCAILLFTADEEFTDKAGKTVYRPSENVVYELGAAGYLYDNRIVIMKEDRVSFPANFRDIGHISFAEDDLAAKAMEVLKELIGFGIVKVST